MRDSVLAAAIEAKRAARVAKSPAGLRVEGVSDGCFVNEHLTLKNKLLFKRAREFASEKRYMFVWSKNCKIYLRKNEGARVIHVSSEATLNKIQ